MGSKNNPHFLFFFYPKEAIEGSTQLHSSTDFFSIIGVIWEGENLTLEMFPSVIRARISKQATFWD